MNLEPQERRLLARVLHGFDTDDGRTARRILQDRLLERNHPWGLWMSRCDGRNATSKREVERGVYAAIHRVTTQKERRWTDGFLTGARLRTKHLEDLIAVRSDPLWLPFESLVLAPNQGDRIPEVARFVSATAWPRLRHLGLDDQRFVGPLVARGFPATLESLYLWALGGVDAAELASALPTGLKRLHVQVFQVVDAHTTAPLFQRSWEEVRVDIAAPWIRDLAAGRVERLELHTASFSLSGTARDTGFDWTIRRHFDDVEHHLWRFVQRWPVEEREQVCPERPPRTDPRDRW